MELGICPNCLQQMTKIEYMRPEFKVVDKKLTQQKITGPYVKYFCGCCNIISDDNENYNDRFYWNTENYKPTEKQEKTIYLINSKLKIGLRALTKHQCMRDIDKYLAIALDNSKTLFDDSIQIKKSY